MAKTEDRVCPAVRALLEHVLYKFHGWWLEQSRMHELLKRGGFQNLPDEVLAKAVLGWRQSLVPTKKKHTVNEVVVTYYRFGQLVKEKFKDPHE
jgi:hypothetical protein